MQTPRCFAIGDIHGHLDALDALLELLRSEAGFNDSDTLIFLGDYVDRGPDSIGVLNRVRALATTRLRTTAGEVILFSRPRVPGDCRICFV